MRSLVVVLLAVLALLAGGVVLAPRLVDREATKADIVASIEALTGRQVTVDGDIDLSLLPTPGLSVAGVVFGGDAAAHLAVDRIDMQIGLLPLLGGHLEVREARVVRPTLTIDTQADSQTPTVTDATEPALPVRDVLLQRVTVVDGRIVLSGVTDVDQVIDDVEAELTAETVRGPFTVSAKGIVDQIPLAIDADVGRLDDQDATTVRLTVNWSPGAAGASTLDYRGIVRLATAVPDLKGRFNIAGPDFHSMLTALGPVLDVPKPPSWSAVPISAGGDLVLEAEGLSVDDLSINLGDSRLQGALDVVWATQPSIDLRLNIDTIRLPQDLALHGDEIAWFVPPSGVAGNIAIDVRSVEYGDDAARRLSLQLRLPGDGSVAVEQARAVLPGSADLSVDGRLLDTADGPQFTGTVNGSTDNARAIAAWLGFATENVPQGRLRTLQFRGGVTLARNQVSIDEAVIRLDASMFTGGLGYHRTDRPRFTLRGQLDRISVDGYLTASPNDVALPDDWRDVLRDVDAAVDLSVGRLTWQQLRLDESYLDGRLEAGKLSLSEVSIVDAAGAVARLVGSIDLNSDRFNVAAELDAPSPMRLARMFGHELPAILARIEPLRTSGIAVGDATSVDVEIDLAAASGQARVVGKVGRDRDRPTYDINVDLRHPEMRELLGRIGLLVNPNRFHNGELSVAGRIAAQPQQPVNIDLETTLGPMQAQLDIDWSASAERPRIDAHIDAEEIHTDIAALLVDLIQPGATAFLPNVASWPGRWPQLSFAPRLLTGIDGRIELDADVVIAGDRRWPDVLLRAELAQDRVDLDRLAMGFLGGRLDVRGSLTQLDDAVDLTADVQLDAVEAAAFLPLLGMPAIIAGPVNLEAEFAGTGSTPYQLVGDLRGQIDMRLRDGSIGGIDAKALRRTLSGPADDLDGNLADAFADEAVADVGLLGGPMIIRRGIMDGDQLGLVLDGTTARIDARIDLLQWALDALMEFRIERDGSAPLAVKLVGPLAEPRLRADASAIRIMHDAEATGAPAQAPEE